MQTKLLQLSDAQFKMDSQTGRFSGYASTFNNVDLGGDTILQGAYTQTLKQNGLPKMFFNHEHKSIPVGKWFEAGEDDIGLYVHGELTPNMTKSNDVRAAIDHGTVDGLSIGILLRKGDYQKNVQTNGNIIKNVTRLAEISIVTFPMDTESRIDVKSEIEELETVRDLERFLRDAGGLSKSMTGALIAQCKNIFGQGEPVHHDFAKIAERINQINQKI